MVFKSHTFQERGKEFGLFALEISVIRTARGGGPDLKWPFPKPCWSFKKMRKVLRRISSEVYLSEFGGKLLMTRWIQSRISEASSCLSNEPFCALKETRCRRSYSFSLMTVMGMSVWFSRCNMSLLNSSTGTLRSRGRNKKPFYLFSLCMLATAGVNDDVTTIRRATFTFPRLLCTYLHFHLAPPLRIMFMATLFVETQPQVNLTSWIEGFDETSGRDSWHEREQIFRKRCCWVATISFEFPGTTPREIHACRRE